MDDVLSVREGKVLTITLNRPHARNSLDNSTTRQLSEALSLLGCDPSLGAGVLTGAEGGFCAGLDLKALRQDGPPVDLRRLLMERSPKPLIAAVEGYAVAGGLELALMCDLIVAARGTKMALPEATRGLLATGGAIFRLPQRLALEMLLTGDSITAEQAHAHGVVSRLVEPGEALSVAEAMAQRIAANAPLPVKHGRELIFAVAGSREQDMWSLQMEARNLIFASNDAAEGASAFVEKRKPVWAGN